MVVSIMLCGAMGGGCARDSVDSEIAWARGVKPIVHDYAVLREQREYREMRDDAFSMQLNSTGEKQVPYSDLLAYPADWPRIVELRDRERKD